MKTWKVLSATALTASLLFAGVPAATHAEDSINYSIFDLSGVLKVGSKGESVKIMQRALNKAMGAELSEDGVFGPNTKTAVVAFQKSKNLSQDGVYGAKTHASLSKAVNSFGFAETSVLKVGSRGEAVKTLQKALNDMSYNVAVDGVYGPNTKAAVVKFQERFPELANDGVFGPKTKTVMDKVLND
ncbi:peptidoglycan-binding domain-containing protein [Bacillus suaedaesalsae]|uniref:Peptidoglycan-binding protein n=1 Tax=Bacillus suaedaesalsae TaxID=2810349 RepID=A0ABS2DK87_9BACI|nr:peptidoglycan-binding protein [Bacillus suaedaesalsae]MBM6617878.1 peptidoglycan-binding protein [Bacillus suaedaesalsae]